MKKVWKIFSQSDGYTYIETFITIIILGLITATIYTQYNKIENFLLKGQNKLQIHADHLNLRLILLGEVQEVRTPWFYKEYKIDEEEGNIKLYYYRGEPELYLDITFNDDGITISTTDELLFQSKYCKGSFKFEDGTLYYRDENFPYQVSTCITL